MLPSFTVLFVLLLVRLGFARDKNCPTYDCEKNRPLTDWQMAPNWNECDFRKLLISYSICIA